MEAETAVRACGACGASLAGRHWRTLFCDRLCKDRAAYLREHPKATGRKCGGCNKSIDHKKSHARYCSRGCKTVASDQRRSADGRNVARDRLRYQQEGVRRREYAREYHRRFPVKSKEFRLRRRARLKDAPTFLMTARDWRRLVSRYRGECAYCGQGGLPLTREHVIPLIRGGHHRLGNVLPVCAPCNYSKRDRFIVEWRYGRKAAR